MAADPSSRTSPTAEGSANAGSQVPSVGTARHNGGFAQYFEQNRALFRGAPPPPSISGLMRGGGSAGPTAQPERADDWREYAKPKTQQPSSGYTSVASGQGRRSPGKTQGGGSVLSALRTQKSSPKKSSPNSRRAPPCPFPSAISFLICCKEGA